jgi:hypothetical protein
MQVRCLVAHLAPRRKEDPANCALLIRLGARILK